MDDITPIELLYIRLRRAGTTMKEVCAKAGVDPSTPSRWTPESRPRAKTLKAMGDALAEIEREKAA